jgi:hypothetical protein
MTLSALGIFSAAGAGGVVAGDYELISTTTLGTATSSITFSNLGDYSSTYKHLQVRLVAQSTQAGTGSNGQIAIIGLNALSMTKNHYLYGNGSSVSSGVGGANGFLVNLVRSGSTNVFSASVVDILDAYSTTKNKTVRWLGGYSSEIALASNLWENTSSITSIAISTSADNFSIGSRFSIYGLRG